MRALAHGTPPDPLWVAGLYDGCDFDDLVQPLAAMMALADDPDGLFASHPPSSGSPRVPDAPDVRHARPAPAGSRAPPAA